MSERLIASIDVPQANTLPLVTGLLAIAFENGPEDDATIARELGIDLRQVDYYKHAARILGFAALKGRRFGLTDRGHELLASTRESERQDILRKAVLEAPIIRRLLEQHFPQELSKRLVSRFIKRNTTLTGATVGRRADTILSWIRTVSAYDPYEPASLMRHAAEVSDEEYTAYRGREEGPAHLALKMAVAENPARYLGEALTLVQVEFPFPTNDRADILFVDGHKRLVAVEIEVDVGAHDLPGLLQAVKYRHMLAVMRRQRPDEVRGMLVARKIHPLMRARADEYGIEHKEIRGVI